MRKFNRVIVADGWLLSHVVGNVEEEVRRLSEGNVEFYSDYPASEHELIKRIGNADCVLIGPLKTTINKAVLDACQNIKYIGISGTSIKNIDIGEVERRNIALRNVAAYADEATAEYVFAQLLMLARNLGVQEWKEPWELYGKKIGIVGLGYIGRQVALRALGFGMNVLYYQRTRDLKWEKKGIGYRQLNELLAESDIITLHVPENTRILGKEEFRRIRRNVVLINTSTGVNFDLDAFLEWIKDGKNFAIIGPYSKSYSEFKAIPNIVIGRQSKTVESEKRLSRIFIDNLKSYLKG